MTFKELISVLIFAIALYAGVSLMNLDPRIMVCNSCDKIYGQRGVGLPGQSQCSCSGELIRYRSMSQKEWTDSQERGYVIKD